MKFLITLILGVIIHDVYADDVTSYLQKYAKTKISDYNLEQVIINNNEVDTLIYKLSSFYKDTVAEVRQKAYYLTYKKAIKTDNRTHAVNILLNSCNDNNGSTIGQNLEFLKAFSLSDFDDKSIDQIKQKLTNHRIPHYKDLVLLAGFTGTGKDILYQKLLDQNISSKVKWYISLALARMGNTEQIDNCLNKAKKLPVDDNFIDYTVPDLIYTRQRMAIDFCVDLINKDEKLCHSLNPDNSESIICGYRVLEMLVPIVINIPASVDSQGNLISNDYSSMLKSVRQWFLANKGYEIRRNTF
jgi:hypothetical protein